MIANWEMLKRHQVLVWAIRALNDPPYRFALVGGKLSGTRREIEALLTCYGIRDECNIDESTPQTVRNFLLNQSKVNVLVSRWEGSDRSLFEGSFASVQSVALRGIIGPNCGHSNDATGVMVDDGEFPAALHRFLREWSSYDSVRDLVFSRGKQWARDIVAKASILELRYVNPAHAERLRVAKAMQSQYARRSTGR